MRLRKETTKVSGEQVTEIAGKGKAQMRTEPPADSDESRAEAWAVYAEELFLASTRETE